MSKKKGIKRHESLQDLSRHHMIGLHVALKLRRAGTEKSRWTIEQIIQDADDFWNPDGQQHFAEEEDILLPAYARYGDIEQPLIQTMLQEHKEIRKRMDELLQGNMSINDMHRLGELLDRHIRMEERQIFPMIERALPEEKLQELAPYLH